MHIWREGKVHPKCWRIKYYGLQHKWPWPMILDYTAVESVIWEQIMQNLWGNAGRWVLPCMRGLGSQSHCGHLVFKCKSPCAWVALHGLLCKWLDLTMPWPKEWTPADLQHHLFQAAQLYSAVGTAQGDCWAVRMWVSELGAFEALETRHSWTVGFQAGNLVKVC